jgi:hypothetical protein
VIVSRVVGIGPPIAINLPEHKLLSGFQSETNLECDLVMTNLAVYDVSSSLDDFEPIHISDSLIRVRNRRIDCFFDTRFRRTDDFKYFVDVIFHFVLAAGVSQKKGPAEAGR